MRIEASGAVTGTPIATLAEAEVAFLDSVAATDGSAEISGGLLAIATGEDESHSAQTASSVWRVYADDAAGSSTADETLIGYGIRALQGDRHAAEFLIAPDHRGQGLGEELLSTIMQEEPSSWCWSHGDHPGSPEARGQARPRPRPSALSDAHRIRPQPGRPAADLGS